MQIASLFAKAGFVVDISGLTAFRTEMQVVKKEMGETLAVINKVNASLKGVTTRFRSIQGLFDPSKMTAWRTSIGAATRQYVRTIQTSSAAIDKLATVATNDAVRLNRFHLVLEDGVGKVTTYAQSLYHLEAAMLRLNAAIRARPIISTPRASTAGAGQGRGSGGGGIGGATAGEGLLASWGIGRLLKPLLPSGIGIGGMLGTGYAIKELVATGREMMAMELKMKAVSRSSLAFANNMEYVHSLSKEMGLDIVQTGNAFANIVVTAQDKMNPQAMQKMFTGFNKYYTAVHMTTEDQRLANLAMQQMFGKDKIQAQEARLQMGQRVTPFIKLLTEAAKEQMGAKFTSFDDVMKKGLLDPSKLLPVVAEKLGKIAENGGAYAQALKNSQSAQVRFTNSLKELSLLLLQSGLDHALATMFSGFVEILKRAVEYLKVFAKALKAIYSLAKLFLDMLLNHKGIVAATVAIGVLTAALMASNAQLLLMMWRIGGLFNLINPFLLRMVFLVTTLIFLMSQWDDYWAGQVNWLTVIQEFMTLLITKFALVGLSIAEMLLNGTKNVDLFIASFLHGINKISLGLLGISDQQKQLFDEQIAGYGLLDASGTTNNIQKSAFNSLLSGMGIGGSSTSTTTTISPTVNVTLDMGNISPQMKAAIAGGDMSAFGTSVGQSISLGGLGLFVGK